jgi:membrane protein implicated in regulation of membrane protease activity
MRELDEVVLGSWPLMFLMALLFGGAFSLAFGLVALVMDGVFVLGDQALLAGLSAGMGFLVVAGWARRRMIDEDAPDPDGHG